MKSNSIPPVEAALASHQKPSEGRRSVLLSTLKHFRLCDAAGHKVAVSDFAIDLLADHHPPVTHIRYRDGIGGVLSKMPWSQVQSVDWNARRFQVASIAEGVPITESETAPDTGDVLLVRDILDALTLDLQNRRAARANDLVLDWRDEDRSLRLAAADMSFVAMLRRLSRGHFGQRVVARKLSDWKYVEFLRGDPAAAQAGACYHRRITRLPPGEIARLVDALPYLHSAELLTLLPAKLAADTLEAMSVQRQLQVFEELADEHQLQLLDLMAPDRATDLLRRLHTDLARSLLSALDPLRAERVIELLRYPEDAVGGIMTNDVLTVPITMTAGEARASLRERLLEPDFIFFIYVVDDETSRRLRGVVTLRTLIASEDSARVEDVMNPYLVSLHALDSAREAAYQVLNSQLVALPVVGKEGRLMGVVTIDEAMAAIAPSAWGATEMRVFS